MKNPQSPMVGLTGMLRRAGRKSVRAIVSMWRAEADISRIFLTALAGLLLMVGNLAALEAVSTIQKIDAEKNALHIRVNGRDRVVTITGDVQVL